MEYLYIFLIVIAGMFVGFLLIVITAYLLIKWWFRRFVSQFAEIANEATKGIAPFMQPLRIQLERELHPEWTNKSAVKSVAKSLKAAGFQDAGTYLIDEVPDVCIMALVMPEKNVYAVIYEHRTRASGSKSCRTTRTAARSRSRRPRRQASIGRRAGAGTHCRRQSIRGAG